MAIKLTGPRSIKSKLERLADELENDATRIMRETPEDGNTVDSLQWLAVQLKREARGIV